MFPARIYIGPDLGLVFGIVLSIDMGATQWTAPLLDIQGDWAHPGSCLPDILVYLPWRLFGWWFAYDAYAPEIFEGGGAIAAAGGVAGALFAILNSVWRARQNQLVTTYGSARWAMPRRSRKPVSWRQRRVSWRARKQLSAS